MRVVLERSCAVLMVRKTAVSCRFKTPGVYEKQIDCWVNTGEGGQLSNFYRNLNDGDQFDVFVRNYGGA
jgi:hypothetical protein